ncbi:MAG: glycoside hydrolase family 43 protein [Treponemataceae bacterium]|nr:glycoside hydrolase family 43 protein [Treponemataceae bacterium]
MKHQRECRKISTITILSLAGVISMFSACVELPHRIDPAILKKSSLRTGVSVHDPSIVAADGKYYVFGSHMASAVSKDLINWQPLHSGVTKYNKLFDNLFDPDLRAFKYVGRNSEGSYSVWAPDVIYNPVMGKWMMYFCTTSTYIKSNLCFAIADSVEGPYHFQDIILYSGFTRTTIKETNVEAVVGPENTGRYFHFNNYKNTLWPNAIDPALFYDAEGRLWMTYGSWSGGIFILEIDQKTGYPIHPKADPAKGIDPYFGRHLAGGLHNSVEGPYIIYDKTSGYYYLFVSYGSLQSNGGYQIRLFRSKNPDGPYTDKKGETLDQGKANHTPYGIKLMGNYKFPTFLQAYMAPGHNSALINEAGDIFLVHHTRFDGGNEYHEIRVRRMFRTSDGWIVAAPFAYNGTEKLATGRTIPEVSGFYYCINHGTAISSVIEEGKEHLLQANGRVRDNTGRDIGSWTYNPTTADIQLALTNGHFEGVLIQTNDEAGNPTLSLTAISENNEALWGVQYLQP